MREWLYEGQNDFRPGYSRESERVTVCQDIADYVNEGARIRAIIIDFFESFDVVPYGRLPMKIAASAVDSRVIVWE